VRGGQVNLKSNSVSIQNELNHPSLLREAAASLTVSALEVARVARRLSGSFFRRIHIDDPAVRGIGYARHSPCRQRRAADRLTPERRIEKRAKWVLTEYTYIERVSLAGPALAGHSTNLPKLDK